MSTFILNNLYRNGSLVHKMYRGEELIYKGVYEGNAISGISINNLTWVTDVPVSGGTATSANCSYTIISHKYNGTTGDVTTQATVNGLLLVPSTTAETRESVGTLNLTATYNGFTSSSSVTAYQKANIDYTRQYLTFEIISDGTIVWKASNTAATKTISYSLDNGTTWTEITSNTGSSAPSIDVYEGDTIMFKGTNSTYGNTSNRSYFSGSTAYFNVYGNIVSLIDGEINDHNTTTLSDDNNFRNLLANTNVVDASNLVLPFTGLTTYCYYGMFAYCTSLTSAPALPATTLAQNCYRNMFYNCRSLTSAPALPATNLATYCYYGMFENCSSLTSAPVLPATTLAERCYQNMFENCSSLTSAPALPATTLAQSCYSSMFYGCTGLNYIKCLATDISASNCTRNWVTIVSANGTFVKALGVSWPIGTSGIPRGWDVEDAT